MAADSSQILLGFFFVWRVCVCVCGEGGDSKSIAINKIHERLRKKSSLRLMRTNVGNDTKGSRTKEQRSPGHLGPFLTGAPGSMVIFSALAGVSSVILLQSKKSWWMSVC